MTKHSKKIVEVLCGVVTLTLALSSWGAPPEVRKSGLREYDKRVISYVLSETEQESARLFLAAAVFQSRASEIVGIDPEVGQKYASLQQNLRNGVDAFLVGVIGYLKRDSSSASGGESLRYCALFGGVFALDCAIWAESKIRAVPSLATSLDTILKWVGKSIAKSKEVIANSSESSVSAKGSIDKTLGYYQTVKTVLGQFKTWLFTGKRAVSLGLGGASGVSSSIGLWLYFSFSDADEVMSNQRIGSLMRAQLGYADAFNDKVETSLKGLNQVFELDAKSFSILKEEVKNQLMKDAIANKFSPNAIYTVDAFSILKSKALISKEKVAAVETIRNLFEEVSRADQKNMESELSFEGRLDLIFALNAYIETLLLNGEMSESDQKHALHLVKTSNETLERVRLMMVR